MRRQNLKASEATRNFTPLPQTLRNIRFQGKSQNQMGVQTAIADIEKALRQSGPRGGAHVRDGALDPSHGGGGK